MIVITSYTDKILTPLEFPLLPSLEPSVSPLFTNSKKKKTFNSIQEEKQEEHMEIFSRVQKADFQSLREYQVPEHFKLNEDEF